MPVSELLPILLGNNRPPTVALNTPADAGTVASTTPTLNFTGTDADSDTVEYNVQVWNTTPSDVSKNHLTDGSLEDPGGTSAVTASITPTANALVLLSFAVRNGASTDPTVSSISGNGLTWVLVDSSHYDDNSSSRRKLFTYRAMGASPSTGAITINLGETDTDVVWTVDEFTGVDTSGTNGSGAIVQYGNNRINTTDAGASSLTVTLSAFSSSSNIAYGAFAEAGTGAGMSIGTGFTQLAYKAAADTNIAIFSEWSTNDNTVEMIMGGSFSGEGGVGIEIKVVTPLINALSASDAGFTAGHPFASASAKDYTVQSALTNTVTYYWRARAYDPLGTNTYGAWSSTRSFTVTLGGATTNNYLTMLGVG